MSLYRDDELPARNLVLDQSGPGPVRRQVHYDVIKAGTGRPMSTTRTEQHPLRSDARRAEEQRAAQSARDRRTPLAGRGGHGQALTWFA